jgi:hypothetical protein
MLPGAEAAACVREGIAELVHDDASKKRSRKASQALEPSWRDTVRAGDVFDWQVDVKLAAFAKPRIKSRYLLPRDRAVWQTPPTRRSAYLKEVGGFSDPVGAPQAKALDYLQKTEGALLSKVLSALAGEAVKTHRPGLLKRFGDNVTERVLPQRMTLEEAVQRVEFSRVAVSLRSLDGMAYLEFHGICTWDIEHGFVVVLYDERVVDICQQGTAWVDKEAPKRKK